MFRASLTDRHAATASTRELLLLPRQKLSSDAEPASRFIQATIHFSEGFMADRFIEQDETPIYGPSWGNGGGSDARSDTEQWAFPPGDETDGNDTLAPETHRPNPSSYGALWA
jgi:hypothetical protein